jgi:anti-anti-sigma factor
VTLSVRGNLDFGTTTMVRAALLKALADCPVAIIVDLAECHVMTTAALAVFPTIAQRHMPDPSLGIAVAGLSEDEDALTPAALGPIPTYPNVHTAYAALTADAVSDRRTGDSTQPTPHAPQRCAAIDEHACWEWRLGTPSRRYATQPEDGTEPEDGALLEIRATPDGGALRVSLKGELDITVADQLTYVVAVELPPSTHLVVDLADVTFCDSAGISAMIKLRNNLAEGNTMSLINTSENVRRVFELSGLVEFLDIHN